jgi:hypothetical protein
MSHNVTRDQRMVGLNLITNQNPNQNRQRNRQRQSQRHRLRPALLTLEERTLLSTIIVNNPTDTPATGQVDLRQAIAQANAATTPSSVELELGTTPATITLSQGQLELSNTSYPTTIYDGPGQGAVTVSGNNASRVFQIDSGVTASISGLTISGGSTASRGGGLYNLGTVTLTDCILSSNTAADNGGGLYNNGTTTLTDSTVSANTAGDGGGLSNSRGKTITLTDCTLIDNSGSAHGGGGMLNYFGTITLTDCTISGNSSGDGAGLANTGTATLTNCTFSGNTAAGNSGALYNSGAATLINCTVSGNSAFQQGGIVNAAVGTATLANTIVAGNTATSVQPGLGADVEGTFTTQGNNLIGEADGSTGWVASDQTGSLASPLNALLSPLGNYGGPTQTMALLPGSPAIDAGSNALIPAGITTDQRGVGFPRIVNGTVDIGAFESSGFTIAVTSGSGQSPRARPGGVRGGGHDL